MSGETNLRNGSAIRENGQWRKLYLAGAISAFVAVAAGLGDIVITFLPGGEFGNTLTMHELFLLLQSNPLVALRNLDLPNLIIVPCGVILFLCLYGVHRKVNKPGAALALLLYMAGAAFMISKIPALTMLSLSGRYVAAPESQKAILLAAGEAAAAAGESHAPATFPGFFLVEAAGILISAVMLKGGVFGRAAAWAGIVGYSCLLSYLLIRIFLPVLSGAGEIIVMIGGLAGVTWYVLTALKLGGLWKKRID